MPADPLHSSLAGRMPPRHPRPIPVQPRHALRRPLRAPTAEVGRARALLAGLTLLLAGGLIWTMAAALGEGAAATLVLGLFALSVGWTAFAAAVALLGLVARPVAASAPGAGWQPGGRTAVLVLTCGEPPAPVAARVRQLHRDLAAAGLGASVEIFLLSDTRGPAAVTEARVFARLAELSGIWWRQRAVNTGRKPGNLADWVEGWGGGFEHMLVLDADSRMRAHRIGAMIRRMEAQPGLGLLQSGIRLMPARSRFGRLQRLSARLCGPGFGRGLAAWTGSEGNFWGHNALIRVAAFAEAGRLPDLPGRAPWGGTVLSHDFVEAAFLRRAGWAVEVDPEGRGSHEDAPQRLAEFHRRDRRWCQGNLQHTRLLFARGLHPASRLHLAAGILGYLAAPLWLGLVLAVALGRPEIGALWPLAGGLALLLVPKAVGAGLWLQRARTGRRRRVVLRAALAETLLSTLLAPLMLWRQTLAVAAVLAGRDSGWSPGTTRRAPAPRGRVELTGGVLLGLAVLPFANPATLMWMAPVLGPLLAAPWLVAWLDAPLRPGRGAKPVPRPVAAAPAPPPAAPERIAA